MIIKQPYGMNQAKVSITAKILAKIIILLHTEFYTIMIEPDNLIHTKVPGCLSVCLSMCTKRFRCYLLF